MASLPKSLRTLDLCCCDSHASVQYWLVRCRLVLYWSFFISLNSYWHLECWKILTTLSICVLLCQARHSGCGRRCSWHCGETTTSLNCNGKRAYCHARRYMTMGNHGRMITLYFTRWLRKNAQNAFFLHYVNRKYVCRRAIPWSSGSQDIPPFGTHRFISMFTIVRHWSLSTPTSYFTA